MGKWGDGSLHGRRKRKVMGEENGLLHWTLAWAMKMEVGSGP